MRILWFANTPCGALPRLTGRTVTGGGWLSSLAAALVQNSDIELHIAFYWGAELPAFEEGEISYHPVFRGGDSSKLGRYVNRVRDQFRFADEAGEIERCCTVVREVQPHLIHIHGSEENFGLLAEQVKDIPVVLSIQGILNPIYAKMYSGFPRCETVAHGGWLKRLILDGVGAADRRYRLKVARERRIFRSICHYIGRTAWDRRVSLALNPQRTYAIVNELMRPEFLQNEWLPPEPGAPVHLVTTISSGLYKGIEMILRVSSLLKQAGADFIWDVIGVSGSDVAIALTRKIYGVNACELPVVFHGRQDAEGMIRILLSACIYVQVSHIENSPNSLCEAMLLGMPCIASFVGGTADMLLDGEEGILVQDGEPYALAGAVMELTRQPERAQRMGQAARCRALRRHHPQRVVADLTEVYNKLLNA